MWKRSAFLVVALLLVSPAAFVLAAPKNLVNTESPVTARCVSTDGLSYESCGGAGVITTLPLTAGEDTVNNLVMTSGGAVRGTVGNVASAVTTNTTSTAVALPVGTKTIYGSVDGTGAVTQTQAIYGGLTSGVTSTTGELLCTLTLSGTTHAHAVCAPITANFLFYIMVSTATTGTGATGVTTAMY